MQINMREKTVKSASQAIMPSQNAKRVSAAELVQNQQHAMQELEIVIAKKGLLVCIATLAGIKT